MVSGDPIRVGVEQQAGDGAVRGDARLRFLLRRLERASARRQQILNVDTAKFVAAA